MMTIELNMYYAVALGAFLFWIRRTLPAAFIRT